MPKAIITGVSEGLGYEVSKLLLSKRWEVLGISRSKPDLKIEHVAADLTKEEDLNKVIEKIRADFSDFSVLINCAGKLNIVPPTEVDYAETENLFKLNVLAPLYLSSKLLDLVKENEATIVNIGSSIGFKAYEGQAAYGTSKWAIRGLNHNLQLELKATKARVIGFNPGGFKSRIFEKATGETTTDWSGWMDPKEIAKLILQTIELPKNMEVSEIVVNRK